MQKFDGFLKVYQEGRDEKPAEDEEDERTLPLVTKGETLALNTIDPEQHFTEPPPRFTEATLVKMLEEKGIGRPSTYAAIMTTIQDREYVEKKEGRFHPTGLGKTVNDVLIEGGFDDLFNETYTARMEARARRDRGRKAQVDRRASASSTRPSKKTWRSSRSTRRQSKRKKRLPMKCA